MFLAACKNPKEEKDNILAEFERINNELNEIDTFRNTLEPLYDSLMSKAFHNDETRQMYYQVSDFLEGYSEDLKSRFEAFVGDATDSIDLSASFFKEKRNDPEGFFIGMKDGLLWLRAFTNDTVKLNEIDAFVNSIPMKKAKVLFTSTPPAAVITMIEYYRRKLKRITAQVLEEYFKRQQAK